MAKFRIIIIKLFSMSYVSCNESATYGASRNDGLLSVYKYLFIAITVLLFGTAVFSFIQPMILPFDSYESFIQYQSNINLIYNCLHIASFLVVLLLAFADKALLLPAIIILVGQGISYLLTVLVTHVYNTLWMTVLRDLPGMVSLIVASVWIGMKYPEIRTKVYNVLIVLILSNLLDSCIALAYPHLSVDGLYEFENAICFRFIYPNLVLANFIVANIMSIVFCIVWVKMINSLMHTTITTEVGTEIFENKIMYSAFAFIALGMGIMYLLSNFIIH